MIFGNKIFGLALKARPWEIVESLYLGYPRNGNSYPRNGKTTVFIGDHFVPLENMTHPKPRLVVVVRTFLKK